VNAHREEHKVLEIRSLAVTFEAFSVVIEGVRLEAGKKLAIIGPNGAGKTAILEALLGLSPHSTVDATLWGKPLPNCLLSPKIRARVGFQLPDLGFPFGLTVQDVRKLYLAAFCGRLDFDLEKRLGIPELLRTRVTALSQGQRKRLDLYFALAHTPGFVALDEASESLDSSYATAFAEIIAAPSATSYIYTTHTPLEAELADELLVLSEGRTRFLGAREDAVAKLLGTHRLVIEATDPCVISRIQDELQRAECVATTTMGPRSCRLVAYGPERLSAVSIPLGETIVEYNLGQTPMADLIDAVAKGPST